jgi:excinuclease UvrABC nuclease subunit
MLAENTQDSSDIVLSISDTRGTRAKKLEKLSADLSKDGWRTPNTYNNFYGELPEEAGIYLFVICKYRQVKPGAKRYRQWMEGVIAYVGKSTCLKRRIQTHNVLREIRKQHPNCFIQTWFVRAQVDLIGTLEIDTIKKFDPPYNVQHRFGGVQWRE